MIFLSASIPDPERNSKYFRTADVIAIRDAVRALATVAIPEYKLIWGGHPAISPLIRYVISTMDSFASESVTMYQSAYFKNQYPSDNRYFESIVYVEKSYGRKASLKKMRLKMLKDDGNKFTAAIFIGGMEGVEEEFELFTKFNAGVPVYPIASTGGAAKFLYDKLDYKDDRLENEYAYMDLFKSLLDIQA